MSDFRENVRKELGAFCADKTESLEEIKYILQKDNYLMATDRKAMALVKITGKHSNMFMLPKADAKFSGKLIMDKFMHCDVMMNEILDNDDSAEVVIPIDNATFIIKCLRAFRSIDPLKDRCYIAKNKGRLHLYGNSVYIDLGKYSMDDRKEIICINPKYLINALKLIQRQDEESYLHMSSLKYDISGKLIEQPTCYLQNKSKTFFVAIAQIRGIDEAAVKRIEEDFKHDTD